MAFCTSCGAERGDSEAFCSSCGTRHEDAAPTGPPAPAYPSQPPAFQPAPPPAMPPAVPPASAPPPGLAPFGFAEPGQADGPGQPSDPSDPSGPAGRKPSAGLLLIVVGTVLAVLLGAFVVWQFVWPRGGAGSPEAAVEKFIQAGVDQDPIALLDV
ncbi:zinc-ribbon domain-containing protein, partial [Nocardioides caeni]